MSALAPVRRPTQAPPRRTGPRSAPRRPALVPRPRLVVVPERRSTTGRLPFVILIGAILTVGLVAVLLLHMMAAQDSFRSTALSTRLVAMHNTEQQLEQQAQAQSAPAALRKEALALGMHPSSLSGLHPLKDGRAVGSLSPVYVPPPAPPASKKSAKSAKSGKPGGATTTGKGGKTGTAGRAGATGGNAGAPGGTTTTTRTTHHGTVTTTTRTTKNGGTVVTTTTTKKAPTHHTHRPTAQ